MIVSEILRQPKQVQTESLCEDSSFHLVSTIITEALGRNCQQILISAKAGSFRYDHSTGIEHTEPTNICIKDTKVLEREQITEIFINGSIRKGNNNNNFSVYFIMKRKIMVIPNPPNAFDTPLQDSHALNVPGLNGTLYNSIFSLDLKCVDRAGQQFPLGKGRGYLIFDEDPED